MWFSALEINLLCIIFIFCKSVFALTAPFNNMRTSTEKINVFSLLSVIISVNYSEGWVWWISVMILPVSVYRRLTYIGTLEPQSVHVIEKRSK